MAYETNILSNRNVLRTSDIDAARETVGHIFCPHQLTPGNGISSGEVVFNHAKLDSVSVNWVDYGRDVRIEPVPFEKFFLLQIVCEGNARIESNSDIFEVKSGQASFINPTDKIDMEWSEHCKKLIVRIERQALERFAENWFGCYLPAPLHFENGLDWHGPQLATARGLVDLIVGDFEAGVGILNHSEAQRHFEDSLFAALLVSHRHSMSHLLTERSSAVPRAVKRAEEYIVANAMNPITVADLVAVTGVSTRTLFESFRRFRGVTPMHYLRRYRLDRVREELLLKDHSQSVTEIAMHWNFEQLGRFSAYYADVFGEKPSDTRKRAHG